MKKHSGHHHSKDIVKSITVSTMNRENESQSSTAQKAQVPEKSDSDIITRSEITETSITVTTDGTIDNTDPVTVTTDSDDETSPFNVEDIAMPIDTEVAPVDTETQDNTDNPLASDWDIYIP